ncbi:MAG TPA: hypothetical protein PLX89_26395, partial [Verrucomicrobiota bacterium]|nr:hypothetical protein [Verrucomicrobiota bacterium]
MNRLKHTAVHRGHNLVRKRQFILSALTLVGVMFAVPAWADDGGRQTQSQDKERIGIYDSRAVAIAYAGSAFQKEKMKALMDQLEEAKKAGDANAMAQLKAEGQAWQMTLHKQGFGTAPVDDLLHHISGQIPKIQKDANVTGLISKWNKTE